MGLLTVFLDKATGLADNDIAGKSDPYVKFEVEQDNWVMDKDYGGQKSTVQADTTSPEWGEEFVFEIPTLENMVLHVKIMDDDILKDDKLGYCKINLEDLELSEDPTPVERVVDDNIFAKDGKVYMTIKYEADAE